MGTVPIKLIVRGSKSVQVDNEYEQITRITSSVETPRNEKSDELLAGSLRCAEEGDQLIHSWRVPLIDKFRTRILGTALTVSVIPGLYDWGSIRTARCTS